MTVRTPGRRSLRSAAAGIGAARLILLKAEGVLDGKQGKGVYVTDALPQS